MIHHLFEDLLRLPYHCLYIFPHLLPRTSSSNDIDDLTKDYYDCCLNLSASASSSYIPRHSIFLKSHLGLDPGEYRHGVSLSDWEIYIPGWRRSKQKKTYLLYPLVAPARPENKSGKPKACSRIESF